APQAIAIAPMLSKTKNIAFETEVRHFAPEKSGVYPMPRLFPGGYTGGRRWTNDMQWHVPCKPALRYAS
ncbi:MAG: hypothetical protein ACHQ1E_06430, partial [Ktedonobacterales bacterium]